MPGEDIIILQEDDLGLVPFKKTDLALVFDPDVVPGPGVIPWKKVALGDIAPKRHDWDASTPVTPGNLHVATSVGPYPLSAPTLIPDVTYPARVNRAAYGVNPGTISAATLGAADSVVADGKYYVIGRFFKVSNGVTIGFNNGVPTGFSLAFTSSGLAQVAFAGGVAVTTLIDAAYVAGDTFLMFVNTANSTVTVVTKNATVSDIGYTALGQIAFGAIFNQASFTETTLSEVFLSSQLTDLPVEVVYPPTGYSDYLPIEELGSATLPTPLKDGDVLVASVAGRYDNEDYVIDDEAIVIDAVNGIIAPMKSALAKSVVNTPLNVRIPTDKPNLKAVVNAYQNNLFLGYGKVTALFEDGYIPTTENDELEVFTDYSWLVIGKENPLSTLEVEAPTLVTIGTLGRLGGFWGMYRYTGIVDYGVKLLTCYGVIDQVGHIAGSDHYPLEGYNYPYGAFNLSMMNQPGIGLFRDIVEDETYQGDGSYIGGLAASLYGYFLTNRCVSVTGAVPRLYVTGNPWDLTNRVVVTESQRVGVSSIGVYCDGKIRFIFNGGVPIQMAVRRNTFEPGPNPPVLMESIRASGVGNIRIDFDNIDLPDNWNLPVVDLGGGWFSGGGATVRITGQVNSKTTYVPSVILRSEFGGKIDAIGFSVSETGGTVTPVDGVVGNSTGVYSSNIRQPDGSLIVWDQGYLGPLNGMVLDNNDPVVVTDSLPIAVGKLQAQVDDALRGAPVIYSGMSSGIIQLDGTNDVGSYLVTGGSTNVEYRLPMEDNAPVSGPVILFPDAVYQFEGCSTASVTVAANIVGQTVNYRAGKDPSEPIPAFGVVTAKRTAYNTWTLFGDLGDAVP